ncbi:hypothetical protein BDV06DRAFT_234285 [Aspergillus oleicola]
MEAPLERNRNRLSLSPSASDETSDVDIHEARSQNDLRLKSIFEGIFEKYGRDFTDIGDEIDLQTGDITVNNGHVHALDGEDHAGAIDWLEDPVAQGTANRDADVEGGDEEEGEEGVGAQEGEGQDIVSDENGNGEYPGRRRVVSILSQMRPSTKPTDAHGDSRDGIGEADGDSDSTTSEAEYFDDRSSVDSLLDTALSLQGPQGRGTRTHTHARQVRQGETDTEKANPHPEQSNQSQSPGKQRLDETVDPIWRVPEINAKFTTPTSSLLSSRSRTATKKKHIVSGSSNSAVRAQSPPGVGSIWALPGTTTRRGNNTDGGVKRRPATTEKKKQKDSPTKKRKKYHSRPPPPAAVICDWSFADTPDGSESDDPLQDDYQPSPTPTKGSVYIREKRKGPFSAGGSKSTTATATTATATNTVCSYCKRTFSSEDGYVSHVRAVLADPANNDHDPVVLKTQLATATTTNTTVSVPRTDHSATDPISNATTSSSEPIVVPTDTPTSTIDSHSQGQEAPSGNSKRARTILGPQEARLIIRMKQGQGMKWKEILSHLPERKLPNIVAWHHAHWSQRRANPPQCSGPWSDAELERLEVLKDQPELTWPGIRAELPGRLLAEIEFKLLQLWAGDVS